MIARLFTMRLEFGDDIMKNVTIKLETINDVKNFVNIVNKYDFDIDLISERYVVDAKSIMGIFSLDLSKPIDLNIPAEDNVDDVLATLKPYMIQFNDPVEVQ